MSSFLQAINIEEDFWQLNPEICFLQPFKDYYNSTANRVYSSKVMWAIYLFCDPDSRFARMNEDEKIKEICDNYLEQEHNIFTDEVIIKLVEAYEDKILSKLQRSFGRLLKKLEERDNFISKTPYNEKNAATLDKMFANSSAIYEQLKAIEDELETEKKSGNIKGGRKESLSERGII